MSKGKGKGVVAAGHELTALAAAEILQDGGNAFDACVAGLFMTFVAEAVFSSPGGGGFLMARRAGSDAVTLFDFFAETPRHKRERDEVSFYPIHADFGPAKQEFHIGMGSSATPGVVPGLFAMHEELCRLPMKRLVEPAVRAARAGFPLSAFQAYLLTVIAPILKATTGVAKIFAPGGTLLKAGETFSNPDLAETIEWLAEDGARLFLDGDVGQAIVKQQRDGGFLTHDDLADYRVARRTPILWQHDGATVALNPPPAASGALIAFGLFYVQALTDAGRALDALALKEAMQATNEARASHGEGLAAKLADGVLAKDMREAARHPAAHRGTTHVSVIDRDGNAVSASLSNGEGNGSMVGRFGFMLNNMLGEEDLTPKGLGKWREGVRLSSMMAPAIILQPDGTVVALGSGGSNRIRTAILQVAVNLLDHGMSLEDAVDAPRLHLEREGTLSFEPGLPEAAHAAFRALGEKARAWPERNLFFGGVHAARRFADGVVEGAGDPRRGGVAIVV
ncbi:gamma-glutamyltransferase family protein [Methyloceanibacter sp.]|uniref:gamma-glutamyltransferase family protein n=1 Tax=Methyloceanibacter sp. TaxID=1965321 RepID=UPI003D6D485A